MFQIRYDMRGEQHDPVLPDLRDQVAEADPLLRVQARRRLIHDEHLRVVEERLRDPEPLLHAAGIGAHFFGSGVLKPGHFDQFLRPAQGLALGKPLHRGHIQEEVPPRKLRVIAKILRKVPKDIPVFLRSRVHSVAGHGPAGRYEDPAEEPHQRCFPRAVRSEQSRDSPGQRKGHPVHRDLILILFGDPVRYQFHTGSSIPHAHFRMLPASPQTSRANAAAHNIVNLSSYNRL